MRSRLILGRMSDDPYIGQRIHVIYDNGRYAVERDTLHDTTVAYRNVTHGTGTDEAPIPARWERIDPCAGDVGALYRLLMSLAGELARSTPLRAVS